MEINSLKVLCTSVPGRYASALFKEGERTCCLDNILNNFESLVIFLKNNRQIGKLLMSHAINQKDLDKGWLAVGAHLSFCPVFSSFIRQLAKNRRFPIFYRIKHIFCIALSKYKNKRNVFVSSAYELLPEQRGEVAGIVSKLFKEKPIISYKINPKLLGGIRISSEEIVYDASLLTQLKQLSSYLKNINVKEYLENESKSY